MKVKKILLPKWVAWFVLIIVFITVLLSYNELRTSGSKDYTSFLLTLILLTFIVIVIFFISYRQIPYLLLMEVRK